MPGFETAFAAWLLFLSNQGIDIKPQLLPPADKTELVQLGETLGLDLPDDFNALYLTANGQLDPYWEDKTFNDTFCPLFGQYTFIPLRKVLSNYRELEDIRTSLLPDIYEVDVRTGDPVTSVDWQPGWLPFAVSNAAYYAVDLSPPRGGTYGQVIEFGHDTNENRVLASSITEFLELAVSHLDPDEPYRYEYYKADPEAPGGRNFSTFFFDMDWTQTPEPPMDSSSYAADTEMDAWNDANHAAVNAFMAWLEGKGYSQAQLEIFRRWTFEMHMPMEMRMGGLLSPPMPDQINLSGDPNLDFLYKLASLELALRASTNYIVEELPVTLENAFTLLHDYRLEMGIWNQTQYDAAEKIISRNRPARTSITDDSATSSYSSIEVQLDGSLLLCEEIYTDDGQHSTNCEVFTP